MDLVAVESWWFFILLLKPRSLCPLVLLQRNMRFGFESHIASKTKKRLLIIAGLQRRCWIFSCCRVAVIGRGCIMANLEHQSEKTWPKHLFVTSPLCFCWLVPHLINCCWNSKKFPLVFGFISLLRKRLLKGKAGQERESLIVEFHSLGFRLCNFVFMRLKWK